MPRFSLKYAVVLLVLLASSVVGVYGFSTLELASMNSGTRTILLSLASLAALTVFTRKPPIILCLGLLACLSIACAQIWPVMVVAAFALSSTVLGRWMLRQETLADWSVHLLVGAGTFGTLTGLAAYLPINYPWLYGALLLLPLVLGRRHVTSIGRELLRQIRASRSAQTPLQTGLDVLIGSFACLYVLVAFMPEVGHDALAMHLFVPSHLAQQHQWKFDANTYVWAVMPMLADWIYSIVYMLAGETASRLSNSAFTLLLAWQIRNMTLWAGGSATSARWASLIFLSTPLAFAESSSLHIESAWTAFMMAGTLAILKVSSSTPEPRERLSQLLLAGLLLGFAMATKAVTLSVLPVLLVILLLHYKAWAVQGIVKTLLLGCVALILAGATPYVSAGYLTGNPVFPFFNAIFHSPLWPNINFEPPATFGTGVTWDTLYRMVFKSPQFIEGRVGAAGFQWLLLPTAAVAVLLSGNKKALCILLVGAGAMFMTFHSTAYLRYVFPSFALFSVILALPFSDARIFPRSLAIVAGAVLILTNTRFIQAATYYGEIKPSALLSTAGRDAYLLERLPIRKMVDTVNALNTGHQPVAVFASPLMAGLHGDALYASWYNLKWKSEFDSAASPSELAQRLRRRQVSWLVIDLKSLPQAPLDRLLTVSTSYARLGDMELRKLNDTRYEHLLNPGLSSLEGWSLTSPSTYDAARKILTVSVKTPATQRVDVTPGLTYINSVSARCATTATAGRIQANWMDEQGDFITTSIETFDCTTQWETHEMNVVAPANATSVIIYASGHTDTPLEFKSLSFRQ
ncbi:phospholipid carrier-dependent glycosyltransferase [Pseudomonas sp. P9_35]|uniref:phospholipid carrier-dependent glycosyltransferase n=1 Tax=unclassified Pseudomonas TaxID=196821 RepID=UPI002A36A716|nr:MULTISPECIES: phospholipid carrier-dependent glycosyltransferase [unclassified Pseudomonas]WPN61594.1 phospholipid carrier-dependent glycosyltransferase [Pseudomonas sp. P9_32]WPN67350.1 phospholipid carrier-dependent glycosyltransferase [Pseudomonas sp. P9_35]